MTLRCFFEKNGSDYNAVIERLISEKMVCKYIKKFPDDPHFIQLGIAIREQDPETAYRAAHTLKGLCLSLGFAHLSEPVIALTEELRNGVMDHAASYYAQISEFHAQLLQWIDQLED